MNDTFDTVTARETLHLARSAVLLYDCAFVTLTRRDGFPLWTLDRRQAEMARLQGVEVVA